MIACHPAQSASQRIPSPAKHKFIPMHASSCRRGLEMCSPLPLTLPQSFLWWDKLSSACLNPYRLYVLHPFVWTCTVSLLNTDIWDKVREPISTSPVAVFTVPRCVSRDVVTGWSGQRAVRQACRRAWPEVDCCSPLLDTPIHRRKMYISFTGNLFLVLLYEVIYLSLSSEGNNDKCSSAKHSKEIHTALNKQKCIKSLSWIVRRLELSGIAAGDLWDNLAFYSIFWNF